MEHNLMDIYGDYRVITVNGAGDTLRVLVENLVTGEREYRVVGMVPASAWEE
jgi:hypothetical protein